MYIDLIHILVGREFLRLKKKHIKGGGEQFHSIIHKDEVICTINPAICGFEHVKNEGVNVTWIRICDKACKWHHIVNKENLKVE